MVSAHINREFNQSRGIFHAFIFSFMHTILSMAVLATYMHNTHVLSDQLLCIYTAHTLTCLCMQIANFVFKKCVYSTCTHCLCIRKPWLVCTAHLMSV